MDGNCNIITEILLVISYTTSVTVHSGSQERGGEELLSNTLFSKHRDCGRHSTHLMTLRLDTEAGKHRAYKGETK